MSISDNFQPFPRPYFIHSDVDLNDIALVSFDRTSLWLVTKSCIIVTDFTHLPLAEQDNPGFGSAFTFVLRLVFLIFSFFWFATLCM